MRYLINEIGLQQVRICCPCIFWTIKILHIRNIYSNSDQWNLSPMGYEFYLRKLQYSRKGLLP